MLSIVVLLSALSACQEDWEEHGDGIHARCYRNFDGEGQRLDWYSAESVCRAVGGHLAKITPENSDYILKTYTDFSWVGGRHAANAWTWSDSTPLNTTQTETLLTLPNLFTPHDACLASFVTGDCTTARGFLCETPVCSLEQATKVELALVNGVAEIRTDVLFLSGVAVAIGRWVSRDRFELSAADSKGMGCGGEAWMVDFSLPSPRGSLPGVEAGCASWPKPASFRDNPDCRAVATDVSDLIRRFTTFGRDVRTTQAPRTHAPPPLPPISTPGPSRPLAAIEEKDEGIPAWVWPIAFVAVAAVSALVSVGALSRRQRRAHAQARKESSSEEDCRYSSEGVQIESEGADEMKCKAHTTESCETCMKFDPNVAKRKLKSVYAELSRGFASPLVVHSSRSVHNGNDHVHLFTVENDFDPSVLGALSTVYSRTKPKLPSRTRIHIVRDDCEDGPFGSDLLYNSAYFEG